MPHPLNARFFAMVQRQSTEPDRPLAQAWRVVLVVALAFAVCRPSQARAAQPLAPVASKPASLMVPGASTPTSTQSIETVVSEAAQRAAERQQIEAERSNLDADYAREQDACLRRFFVNDCLDRARRRYNKQSDALDASLSAIDLAARQQRAEAERRRVEQNLRERRPVPDASAAQQQRLLREQEQARKQREQADRAAGDAARQAAYEAKQRQAQGRGPSPSAAPASPAVVSPGANARSAQQAKQQAAQRAAQIQAAEAAYAQKQADYQRRQAQAAQQREQAKQSGSAATPPLPLPPGY